MAYTNYWRITIRNTYLGVSKEISAPTKSILDERVQRQYQIWNNEVKRRIANANKERLKSEALKLTEIDQNKIDEYKNIINKINFLKSKEVYDNMKSNEEYVSFQTNLLKPVKSEIYKAFSVPKESFFEIIFNSIKLKRIEKEKEADRQYEALLLSYNIKLNNEKKEYEKEKEKFIKEQREKNNIIDMRYEFLKRGDVKEIEKYFSIVLENSIYPENFIKNFELQYIKDIKKLIVSYELPNIDIIPRTIQHKYIVSRNEIDEIKMKDKDFEKFYNDIIYMSCLKTLKEIFSADDLDFIDSVVYNGWVNFVDRSTGNNSNRCIISVDASKEQFKIIKLEQVDYKECIKGLRGLFAPSMITFTPVIPILNINREDKRFIQSKEVEELSIDGFNLATMPWDDFEYFVRELFDKMFNKDGGEVKVTRASHDGGVDAIAFDDNPIFGGKFVIQAKRYNNVVPVSAVRDLYGTMIHEGATKGILVTTSFFGKDSYEFSKDKPLTLINGQELLGLLDKYGYKNLTIKLNN